MTKYSITKSPDADHIVSLKQNDLSSTAIEVTKNPGNETVNFQKNAATSARIVKSGGGSFSTVEFYAPLTNSLALTTGSYTPTFARASTAYVPVYDTSTATILREALSGEARFEGAYRVENLAATTSENFSDASWVKTSCTETSGATDPNGGTDAFSLSGLAAAWSCKNDSATELPTRLCRVSGWVKRNTGTDQSFRLYYGGNQISNNMTATDTWQRFTYTSGSIGGSNNIWGITRNSVDDAAELLIYGFQLEDITGMTNQNPGPYVSVGVESTPYHGANVDGVQYFNTTNGNTVSSNVVTEATGTAIAAASLKGYLNEKGRTNLCLYSGLADGTGWDVTGCTPTYNDAVAPDGTTTAIKVGEQNANNYHRVKQEGLATVINNKYTYSVYAKADEQEWFQWFAANATSFGTDTWCNFHLSGAGAIGANKGGTQTETIERVGDSDWYFCTMTVTALATGSGAGVFLSLCNDQDYATRLPIYLGNGIDGVHFWQPQFEAGAFATSRMPTAAATEKARSADVLSYDYQPNALLGSILTQFTPSVIDNPATEFVVASQAGANYLYIKSSSNAIESGDGDSILTFNNVVANTLQNVGATWEDGASPERAGYQSGTQVDTAGLDANGYAAGSAPLGIGSRGDDGSSPLSGHIKEVKFYTDAKTQAFMEGETT